jgi:Hsp20/alpha crystallin family
LPRLDVAASGAPFAGARNDRLEPPRIDVERVEAELKGGVLTVTVSKSPELHPRQVSIKGWNDS